MQAVYCRNDLALSQTTAWTDAAGPDDPRVGELFRELFQVVFSDAMGLRPQAGGSMRLSDMAAGWYRAADFLLSRLDAEAAHGLAIRALKSGLAAARPQARSAVARRHGLGPHACPTRSASPPASTRTPKCRTPCSDWASAWSRSAASRRGRRRAIRGRACSALPRIAASSTAWASTGRPRRRALAAERPPRQGFVGVNVGANKDSTDRAADYVTCAAALAPYADYLVCNVSSPNTPGLRNLQGRVQLADLLKRVQDAIAAKPVPLLVKIAPDATDDDLDDIVAVCRDLRMDGIIVGNTTLGAAGRRCTRHGAARPAACRVRRSWRSSTEVLRKTAQRVERQFPLIGSGGVGSGADAYAKIRAGATLVQLYSMLVYEGPPLVRRIKDELAALLARDRFASVADAVGADL